MRTVLIAVVLLGWLPPGLRAENAAPPAAPRSKPVDSPWVFSLLPKSLQSNPNLDLTVITELTELGRKLPPVSPEKPEYYSAFASGFVTKGDAPANQKPFPQADLERLLRQALARNGYLPAQPPAHPPTLQIFYVWGAHHLIDSSNEAASPTQIARNILDRAALVGGEKFAAELRRRFEEADALASATPPQRPTLAGEDTMPVLSLMETPMFNPVYQFKQQSAKNEFLVDQAADDCYYVVASAYDYAALTSGKRWLLWRTRMTVNARGVSLAQSLPTLIASAAPFFGREMAEPEVIVRRARDVRVEVGTPTVVEENVATGGAKK